MKTLGFVVLVLAATSGWAAEAGNGKAVFGAKCAACHGKNGKGNPGMANLFKVELGALDLTGAGLQGKTDEDLTRIVSKGKNKMPAFAGKLEESEIADTIAYLRSLGSPTQGKEEAAPADTQAADAKLYASKCAACHGKDGKGNSAMAKMFKADPAALNLAGDSAQNKTDEELAAVINSGVRKMPSFKGKLDSASIKGLVGYIRSLAPPKSK